MLDRARNEIKARHLGALEKLEVEIVTAHAGVEHLHLKTQVILEVLPDLVNDVALGGGGEPQDRGDGGVACVLADVPRGVAIVGAEVVAPL